jgi:hypothetical protein
VKVVEASTPKEPIVPSSAPVTVQMPPNNDPIIEREHRRLQHLIKRLAEQSGYLATIEQPTDDGTGRVDIGLERDSEKTACEISVTTTPEHELGNVRKCLASDYGRVIVCSPEKKHLVKIKRLCNKELTKSEMDKLLFLEPAELTMMFEEEAANAAASTGKVKGYKVNTTYQPLDEAEREAKRQALANTILRSLRPPKE